MFKIAEVMCIRTSGRKRWIPIHTEMIAGKCCVKLNSTKNKWAVDALVQHETKRESQDAHLVLQAFEDEIRTKAVADGHLCSTEDTAASSQERDSPPKKQRLADSDDEAEDQNSPQAVDKKKKVNKKKSLQDVGFMTMRINENDLQIGFHKGPGLILPADVEILQCVICYLNDFYDPLLASGRGIVTKKKDAGIKLKVSGDASSKKKDAQHNRIRYDLRRSAYIVWYQDAVGSSHRISKGLGVPREDVMGKAFTADQYAKAKAAIMKKAEVMWNQLDASGRSRYP